MAALTQIVPIESRRRPLTEAERLRAELDTARGQIDQLTTTVSDQAKTLAAVTDDCPPWAPSLAIVYWKWSDARRSQKAWKLIWARVRWLIGDIGDLPAPLLTPLKWDEFRARRRLHVTYRGGPPCEATLNLELIYARAMLNWAVDRGMIKRNPLLHAKQVPTISQRETLLTPDDVERLLLGADDVVNLRLRDRDEGTRPPLLKAFILCCFDSMLRFTEARTLRLNRIGTDGAVELLASETKSKRRRFIELTPRTLDAIRAIKRRPGATYVFEGPFDHPGKGKYGLISDSAMRYWFRRACERSGLDERATARDKRVRVHDLRAGGATAADELGARPSAIRDALGHASLEMTERYLRSEGRNNARTVAAVLSKLSPARPRRIGRRKAVA